MQKIIKTSIRQIILLTILFSNTSQAALVLDRSIVIMESTSKGRVDVAVINDSQIDKLYVSVELFNVESPGQDQKLEKADPSSKKEFIVSPSKLVVPPGERKLVRLLNLTGHNDQERIYRVNFTPIVKPMELKAPVSDGTVEIVQPGVQVVVAYQVLVIILPETPKHQIEVTREGKNAVFKNAGNANTLFFEGQQCNPDDKSECSKIPGFRLYPGNNRTVELPYDSSLSFSLRNHEGVKKVIY